MANIKIPEMLLDLAPDGVIGLKAHLCRVSALPPWAVDNLLDYLSAALATVALYRKSECEQEGAIGATYCVCKSFFPKKSIDESGFSCPRISNNTNHFLCAIVN